MSSNIWKDVYNTEYIYSPNCWKSCNGYCCKNFYGEHYKILDKNGVALPLLASEYAYYKSIGGISNITQPAKQRDFTLNNGKTLSLFLLSCSCGGLCDPHGARPLICRIYPYFPVVNAKGEILDFEYAALMDLFYRNPEESHKCTLVREHAQRVKNELRENLKPLLKSPEIIFVFMTLKLLVDRLKEKMDGYIHDIPEEKKGRFIQKYEWMILSGKPWRNNDFTQAVTQAYEDVKNAHGGKDFL